MGTGNQLSLSTLSFCGILCSSLCFTINLVLYASINVVLYALIVIFFCIATFILNRIDGVIDGVLASSVVDPGIESLSGQTKDYKISICCFSCKHAALRRTSKDWLARNQNNVSKWGNRSIRGLLFQ